MPALLEAMPALARLDLRGLMTIPPPAGDPEDVAPLVRGACASCATSAARRLGRPLPELSMGMTDDFEVAIEEGATLVRVGRAIFGDRHR